MKPRLIGSSLFENSRELQLKYSITYKKKTSGEKNKTKCLYVDQQHKVVCEIKMLTNNKGIKKTIWTTCYFLLSVYNYRVPPHKCEISFIKLCSLSYITEVRFISCKKNHLRPITDVNLHVCLSVIDHMSVEGNIGCEKNKTIGMFMHLMPSAILDYINMESHA